MNIQEPYRRFAINIMITYINGNKKKVTIVKIAKTGKRAAEKAIKIVNVRWRAVSHIQLLNWQIIPQEKGPVITEPDTFLKEV